MQQQPSEGRDHSHNPNIRFRKVSFTGSTVQAIASQFADKVRTKELVLELPSPEHPEEGRAEEEYCRRSKAENGIKNLLKAYEETRKKNSSECMSRLGLDVIKIQSFSSNKQPGKLGKSFPAPIIHSKKSLRKLELKDLVGQKEVLLPLKSRSGRDPKPREDDFHEVQFRHLIEMTTSLTNFCPQKDKDPKLLTSQRRDPKRVFKRETKAEDYLYKRLEGTERRLKEEQNQIYDRRIKSFLDFLWKNMFAHGVYLPLDLKSDDINARPRKLKAYVALGNNGAMVRGLIKRRFWWTLVEERTSDCQFVWTQVKVNEIFGRQERAQPRRPLLRDEDDWDEEDEGRGKKGKLRLGKLGQPAGEAANNRLMHKQDVRCYKRYYRGEKEKDREYAYRLEKNPKRLEVVGQDRRGMMHNHLEFNFYLGNKKALFYNLREYYSLQGLNVFNYLPITFHIRKGTRDPEYTRFVQYYKRRARQMKKQAREEQECESSKRVKTRNIWIVKPGENTNQGRGITVIDEIYELNSILKLGRGGTSGDEENESTYIVQMYLDRPLLYSGRKFDIRHYMLITNFFGVQRAYWYEQGYIRTSSYEFDVGNFQPEIHLTNDAIQKRYPDYGKHQPYNKLSYEQFQRYLDGNHSSRGYNFREQIMPQMQAMGTDAARSVFTKISPKNQMNNFEILGLDFMIDRNFKPWLIEINTNPCLDCSSPLSNRIIPYLIEQTFKLTLDLAHPPPTHYPNTCKHFAPNVPLETFKYKLIFDSQHDGPPLTKLYRRVRSNFLEQIGEIEEDQEFKDEGKECKLDDYS